MCRLNHVQAQRQRPRSNSEVVGLTSHRLNIPSDTAAMGTVSSAGNTPMSQLLATSQTPRIGPDQFVELFYRSTAAFSGDAARDAAISRGRRVSVTYLFAPVAVLRGARGQRLPCEKSGPRVPTVILYSTTYNVGQR